WSLYADYRCRRLCLRTLARLGHLDAHRRYRHGTYYAAARTAVGVVHACKSRADINCCFVIAVPVWASSSDCRRFQLSHVSRRTGKWIERLYKFMQPGLALFRYLSELDSVPKRGMVAHDYTLRDNLLLSDPERDFHFLRNLLRRTHLNVTSSHADITGLCA